MTKNRTDNCNGCRASPAPLLSEVRKEKPIIHLTARGHEARGHEPPLRNTINPFCLPSQDKKENCGGIILDKSTTIKHDRNTSPLNRPSSKSISRPSLEQREGLLACVRTAKLCFYCPPLFFWPVSRPWGSLTRTCWV